MRDPLFHFLVAGAVFFAGFHVLGPGDEEASRYDIRVDRPALLSFLQSRAQATDDGASASEIAALPKTGLTGLVKDYAREEALYREAVSLGLDKGDVAIRRRLIQSLEFAALNASASDERFREADLKRFYDRHLERYSALPSVTFTHVFFSAERHGWPQARGLAGLAQARLARTPGVEGEVGDRFLYQRNYVDEDAKVIASQFGGGMADALFRLRPNASVWQGPVESAFGVHLLKIVARKQGGPAPFEEVRGLVQRDAADEARKVRQNVLLEKLAARYRVHVADGLPRP